MCCKPFPVLHGHMLWHRWVHRSYCVWEISRARIPPRISKPNEHRSSGSGLYNLLVCCFHEDYNITACRICINRFWLAGGKAIILIGFPFYTCIAGVNPQPWMSINTLTKDCTASIRSALIAPISPNALLKSWTEILQKTFPLPYKYDIISVPVR